VLSPVATLVPVDSGVRTRGDSDESDAIAIEIVLKDSGNRPESMKRYEPVGAEAEGACNRRRNFVHEAVGIYLTPNHGIHPW